MTFNSVEFNILKFPMSDSHGVQLAQNAGLFPAFPLYDQESQMLKPRCIRALKCNFILSDLDRYGALSDAAELNDCQVHILFTSLIPFGSSRGVRVCWISLIYNVLLICLKL